MVTQLQPDVRAYLHGAEVIKRYMEKYYGLGYEVENCPPPAGYKDYNEWLVATKLSLFASANRTSEIIRA